MTAPLMFSKFCAFIFQVKTVIYGKVGAERIEFPIYAGLKANFSDHG
jgi:hypothetical protein